MVLEVNGVNMVPYIKYQGLKWTRNDIDCQNSGRTLDGSMVRGRVSTKIRLDITCRPLTAAELSIVLNAIYPEYVTVTYDDPMMGRVVKTMYSNNNPASYCIMQPTGEEWWSDVSFPLIEK